MKICELIIIFRDKINSNVMLINININNKNLSIVLFSHPFAFMKEFVKYLEIISRLVLIINININNNNLSIVLFFYHFAFMKEFVKYLEIISRLVLIINLLKIKINNIKTSISVNTFNVNDILNNSIKGFITSLLSKALLILN